MTTKKDPQLDKFKDAARDAGCDEDEARFEETLRQIAKAPPSADKQPAKRTRGKRPN
jgi:hypothetical protein